MREGSSGRGQGPGLNFPGGGLGAVRPFQTQKGRERNCVLEELTGCLVENRLKEKKLKKKKEAYISGEK